MKKYIKYIAFTALSLGFSACTQEEIVPQQSDIVKIASANIATEVKTRVNTLNDGNSFENGDKILVVSNNRDTKNVGTYTYNGSTWDLTEGMLLYAASGTNDFTACYPASTHFTLPTDQSTEDKIKSADRMTATAADVEKGAAVSLEFVRHNAKVTINTSLTAEFSGKSISTMTIQGVTPYCSSQSYTAILEPSDNGFSVALTIDGKNLTAESSQKLEAGKHYILKLIVGRNSASVNVNKVESWGSGGALAGGVAEEDVIPYLTFVANEEQSLTIIPESSYILHESLQYSVNGGDWIQLTANTPITFGGDNGSLRMRGKSTGGLASSTTSYAQISFANQASVECSGDIRTLLDYENYLTVDTKEARFCHLFYNCNNLTIAPDLPATSLADNCYKGMFRGCSSLIKAPALPATTLTSFCYANMFNSCYSLNVAPELPATSLADHCYLGMFSSCIALTTAPMLPSTILAEGCYRQMFSASSLRKTPDLPAITLAKDCYYEMFYGCPLLKEVSALPATTLANKCYYRMFGDCFDLISAPELSATTLSESCYERMFEGCKRLTIAPSLPATTLAATCYLDMFKGCTSLTVAPSLPATTLAENCYYRMFYGCSALITPPALPAVSLAIGCYMNMFYGCSSLVEAPELPATTLQKSCYSSMFEGCTSLTIAPSLPAITLVQNCYYRMFYGCSKLSSVTMLATENDASLCHASWLVDVSTTGTFTKAASMTSLPTGSSGIPEGWDVKDYTN